MRSTSSSTWLHSVRARSPTRWSSNSRARPRRSRNRRTGSRPTRPWHSPRPSAERRGLREAMETLIALQRSGTLDELAEVAEVGSLATAALDDEMVRSLAGTGSALGEVADTAADDDTRDGLKTLLAGSAPPNGAIRNQWAHLGSRGDPRSGGPVRARLRARDLEGDRARTRGDRRRRVRSGSVRTGRRTSFIVLPATPVTPGPSRRPPQSNHLTF